MDKEFRMKNLYSVSPKEGGDTIRFAPNEAQKALFSLMKEKKNVIVLKARQLGITTAVTTFLLDETLFNRNTNSLTIAHSSEWAIATFVSKVRFCWDNFPPLLREHLGWNVDTERANQLTFNFGDGSSSTYAVSTSGRSGTFHNVHVTEFAKLCVERPLDAKEVISGAFPAVPMGGRKIIESTAEGEQGLFYQIWHEAVAGKSEFTPLFINWRYDIGQVALAPKEPLESLLGSIQEIAKKHNLSVQEANYYQAKLLMLGNDLSLLKEQYPTTAQEAFIGSGDKYFDMGVIEEYESFAKEGIKKGNFTIFSPKRDGRCYVIGADPSEGVGADHSAAVVWEVDQLKASVVATYASDACPPEDFAYLLKELSDQYGKACVVIERNNHGHAVIAVLRRIADESIIYRDTEMTGVELRESQKFGFHTTSVSKPLVMTAFKTALQERCLLIPSSDLLLEMRLLPRTEAVRTIPLMATTKHFDLLMAAVIGLYGKEFALARRPYGPTEEFQTRRVKEFDPFSAI